MELAYRPLNACESDVEFCVSLRQDKEVLQNLHDQRLYPEHQCKKWIESMSNKSERYLFFETDKDMPDSNIGLFRVDNVDEVNKNCYVGLDIVRHYRGKKLARPIYQQMLEYLFDKRNMDVLYLEYVDQGNFLGKFYSSLGFIESGYFYNKIKRNNTHYNSVLMYLTRDGWLSTLHSSPALPDLLEATCLSIC